LIKDATNQLKSSWRIRSTADQIFTLQEIFEKCWEYTKHVYEWLHRPLESISFGKCYVSLLQCRQLSKQSLF